jgi:hypothetical protein
MKYSDSFMNGGSSVLSGNIRDHAFTHCSLAQSIKVGEAGETKEGYVVRRVSPQDWIVVSAPAENSQYQEGEVVKGRVLFWRMNGLKSKRMVS